MLDKDKPMYITSFYSSELIEDDLLSYLYRIKIGGLSLSTLQLDVASEEIKAKIEAQEDTNLTYILRMYKELYVAENSNLKLTVFMDSRSDLMSKKGTIVEEIEKAFGGKVNHYVLQSTTPPSGVGVLEHFFEVRDSKVDVLFTLNQYADKVIESGSTGVIIYKSTDVFMQDYIKLGASIKSNIKSIPLIIDLVNNIKGKSHIKDRLLLSKGYKALDVPNPLEQGDSINLRNYATLTHYNHINDWFDLVRQVAEKHIGKRSLYVEFGKLNGKINKGLREERSKQSKEKRASELHPKLREKHREQLQGYRDLRLTYDDISENKLAELSQEILDSFNERLVDLIYNTKVRPKAISPVEMVKVRKEIKKSLKDTRNFVAQVQKEGSDTIVFKTSELGRVRRNLELVKQKALRRGIM